MNRLSAVAIRIKEASNKFIVLDRVKDFDLHLKKSFFS